MKKLLFILSLLIGVAHAQFLPYNFGFARVNVAVADTGSIGILAYNAPISSTSDGTVSANALYPTYFNNVLSTKSTFNLGTYPFIYSQTALDTTIKSKRKKQNVEVSFYGLSTTVFLRAKGGYAIKFTQKTEGAPDFKFFIDLQTPTGTAELWRSDDLQSLLGMNLSDSSVANDLFTVGADGTSVYASFNGTRFITLSDWRLPMEPGEFGIISKTNDVYGGVRAFNVKELKHRTYLSDFVSIPRRINPKDFGFKTGTTTGSITAGSPVLTVADPSQFNIGDYITIQIGKEYGGGLIGSVGVGGVYPILSYPSFAAMSDDNSQPAYTMARDTSTGNVYRYIDSLGMWLVPDFPPPVRRAIPLSLYGQIISKSGNDLTLDSTAKATVVGADVFFDNNFVLNKLWANPANDLFLDKYPTSYGRDLTAVTPRLIIDMPAGRYQVSQPLYPTLHDSLIIRGAGDSATILFSAKGVGSFNMHPVDCKYLTLEKFGYEGNAGLEGFGLLWRTWNTDYAADVVPQQFSNKPNYFPYGLQTERCDSAHIHNLNTKDVWAGMVTMAFSHGSRVHNIQERMRQPLGFYRGWWNQSSNSVGDTYDSISVVNDYQSLGSYEAFASDSITFDHCDGINALYSSNTSQHTTFKNFTARNKRGSVNGFQGNRWTLQFNTNIGNQFGSTTMNGGKVINGTIISEDVGDTATGLIMDGIIVGNYRGVEILNSSYTSPNWVGGTEERSPNAVRSAIDTLGVLVDSFTVVGAGLNPGHAYDYEQHATIALKKGTIQNCTMPVDATHIYMVKSGQVTMINNTGTVVTY